MHKISECLQQSVVQIFILRMDFVNVSIFLALFIDWSMFTNVVLYYKYVKDEINIMSCSGIECSSFVKTWVPTRML